MFKTSFPEALVPSASAASLHRAGMSLGHLDASSGAHVSQLHRAITLDRGLDVLAAQNLSMKPESALRTKAGSQLISLSICSTRTDCFALPFIWF